MSNLVTRFFILWTDGGGEILKLYCAVLFLITASDYPFGIFKHFNEIYIRTMSYIFVFVSV